MPAAFDARAADERRTLGPHGAATNLGMVLLT
jgi:hypothetical protein